MANIFETKLPQDQIWYFGNNRRKDLRLSQPKWNYPFFLTTSYEYARDYADYGVYKIILSNQEDLNILDFNNQQEVQLLHWPEIVVKTIQAGKNDLNSIAYDLYVLAYGEGKKQPTWIEDTEEWRLASYYFRDKSLGILDYAASGSIWGSEEDHAFLMQMWKDIHDAGFDGFMHIEFGQKVLALFDLRCIGKISPKPVDSPLDEKQKNRLLKKAFKAKGQEAFPEIKSDDDIVFVSGIPKDKALQLLKRACHDVSNFHPEYMEKAVKWSDDQIFGVFNKHDKRNVLAMASVSYNGDESGAAYLHEMTGFIKGGYGKKLVIWLLQKFKKVYGQIALEGSGTEDDPYKPNEKLRDKFYATIPGVKIYRIENSVWDCPADFFYYGISDESIKEFLEKTYGSKESLNEDSAQYDPPYTLEQIKTHYPENIYVELANDPVHRWRAETGIELIHREPTEEELDRIWRNWQLMPKELKDISDKKSLELFGCTNAENYKKLKSSTIDESKQTYLWKYRDEKDAEDVVKTFWSIRSRLQPPLNDIDWWIKKPFADLRNFVQTHDFSNKRSRRDAEWRSEALQNDAKMLGERDGYEIWYVPTYESMKILGRFYKGRSAKWCVASDDPDWWFDHHDEDEYVLLIREDPLNDEFDKVAIQMENRGRHFTEDNIIPWDLENNDWTFDRGVVEDAPELMRYAWELFRENGELREHYY